MRKDDTCLLEMLQAAPDATSFLEGRDEAGFYEDRVLHHAIMMLLVVIDENAYKISKDFQDTFMPDPLAMECSTLDPSGAGARRPDQAGPGAIVLGGDR